MTKGNSEKQNVASKDLQKLMDDGKLLVKLNHLHSQKVKLNIADCLLDRIDDEIDLLYPMMHHVRGLAFMYIQELIDLLPEVKKEGVINTKLLSIVETLLFGLDYLTHNNFINAGFNEEHKEKIKEILKETFDEKKTYVYSTDAQRPKLLKSKIFKSEDEIYAEDNRESTSRIYMAVLYKKYDSVMDRFKQVGRVLNDVNLKIERDSVNYEEMLEGKTNIELHEELILYINVIKGTLCWLLNSLSWRNNELHVFDEIDICSKLGIKK